MTLVLACLLGLPGCLARGRFHCDDDRQCTSASGARGFCEASGACSFEDRGCALGRRYARFTDEAGQLGGRCVDARACTGTPVVELQAGGEHACLRRLDGNVFCWGRNDEGQLGDGSFTARSSPTAVSGLPGPALALALGGRSSCAIQQDRRVSCWGLGNRGPLGGAREARAQPREVVGVAGALELALGQDFACARSPDGVSCWGDNDRLQLGRGPDPGGPEPQLVVLPAPADQVVAGAAHACARLRDGRVACWGDGDRGQLGLGDQVARAQPTLVAGLGEVIDLAAGGAHTCARTRAGLLHCWGANDSGQLGLSGAAPVLVPAVVRQGQGATRVRLGARHTCLVLADEGVVCFGARDRDQLGWPPPAPGAAPAAGPPRVVGLGNVLDLSVGADFACALQRDTTVRCWGDDGQGQLGAGAPVWRARPSALPVAGGVSAIAAGASSSCLVRAGEVTCAGAAGSIGSGSLADQSIPAPVRIPAGIVDLAAGASGACARTLDRELWCWGTGVGQLPRPRAGVSAVDQVSHGRAHACALARARVLCWGENGAGQLGQPVSPGLAEPAAVPVPGAVLEVSAGGDFTCARAEGGAVHCWGEGGQGQLGDGRSASSVVPVAVALPEPALAVSSGQAHACARGATAVYCWGRGAEGQLGDGRALGAPAPVAVSGLAGAEALALGADFSCAVVRGALSCWGAGHAGQSGEPGGQPRPLPAAVTLPRPVKRVAAGGAHTCVLDDGGDAHCFGLDTRGQLGTGRLLSSAWPRPLALACP